MVFKDKLSRGGAAVVLPVIVALVRVVLVMAAQCRGGAAKVCGGGLAFVLHPGM